MLKRLADKHGIAILLIHHLRKETADDVFNRISGTTAISGAVDSSFTLVEDRRGSGKAKLSCIGRDIEYRELSLERNVENVWEMVADSRTQPELLGDRITYLVSELMRDRTKFIGTPTELSEKIDPVGMERISPKKVSRLILQNLDALSKIGISGMVRRSNGKRLIELRRAESGHLWPKAERGCSVQGNHLLGGGQHRVCLVCGNAAARLPHEFRAEARTHFIYDLEETT